MADNLNVNVTINTFGAGDSDQAVHSDTGHWMPGKVVHRNGRNEHTILIKFRGHKDPEEVRKKYVRSPVPHVEVSERVGKERTF